MRRNSPVDYVAEGRGFDTPCWIWQGGQAGGRPGQGHYGYAWNSTAKTQVYAHRLYYERYVGPIPAGMTVDHRCAVKLCVNPNHLDAVSQAENNRRYTQTIDCCPQGHPYDGVNTRVCNGMRFCRTCDRDRARARRAR